MRGYMNAAQDRQKERVMTPLSAEKGARQNQEKYAHETLLQASTVRLEEPGRGENRGKNQVEEDHGSELTSLTMAAGYSTHSPLFSLFCSMMLYCSWEPISCFCCRTEVGFQQCFSFGSPPTPSPPPLPPVPLSEFMLLPMMADWMSWVVAYGVGWPPGPTKRPSFRFGLLKVFISLILLERSTSP